MAAGGSQSSPEDDRDIMKILATRLLGCAPAVANAAEPSQKAPSPSTPRSLPAVASSSKVSIASQSPTQSWPGLIENVPPAAQPATTRPPSADDDMTMAYITAGPSLRGSAEALAAAREFADSATQGGSKARRGARPVRERLLSAPRPTVFAAITTNAPATVVHRASASSSAGVNAMVTSTRVPTSHDRSPGKPAPMSPSEDFHTSSSYRNWNSLQGRTAPKAKATQATESHEAAATKSPQYTEADPNKEEALSLFQRQKANILDAFKAARTEQTPPPPHLRQKAAAAGIPERVMGSKNPNAPHLRAKATNSAVQKTHATPTKPGPASSGVKPSALEPSDSATKPPPLTTTSAPPESLDQQEPKPQSESKPQPDPKPVRPEHVNGMTEAGPSKSNVTVEPALRTDETLQTLNAVKAQLATMIKRVEYLEKDNREIHKQMQVVVLAEERRKFLGTDDAKTPFGLDVKCPNGAICKVQARADLKVYDLVRRACLKLDIVLTMSSNPRVNINGTEVGHGMTLGEVGVDRDANAEVELSYEV